MLCQGKLEPFNMLYHKNPCKYFEVRDYLKLQKNQLLRCAHNAKILFLIRDKLDASLQSCVECYTSDWVVVRRRYQNFSSSVRR